MIAPGAIVVIKSTVPAGTGDEIEELIASRRGDREIAVVSNPEFLREGCAIGDFMNPDRVVIGTGNDAARCLMLDVYRPLAERQVPIVFTQRRTSELIKYAANSFLAVKISFINEMADLCEAVGADVGELALAIGLDRRVGASFLNAGPGYGGSCFPKDTLALLHTARENGVDMGLVGQSVSFNLERRHNMLRKIASALGGSVKDRTIAILGLSFKPETDDVRESPAIALIELLRQSGAMVRAYDPVAMANAAEILTNVEMCESALACAGGADAVVIVTEWSEFRALDLLRLRGVMAGNVIVDLRNIVSTAAARRCGFRLANIGHAEVRSEGPEASNGEATHAREKVAVNHPMRMPDGGFGGEPGNPVLDAAE